MTEFKAIEGLPTLNFELGRSLASRAITQAIGALLNTKHLYQPVDVETDEIDKRCRSNSPYLQNMKTDAYDCLHQKWMPSVFQIKNDTKALLQLEKEWTLFDLPDVRAFCPVCEKIYPFNPLHEGCNVTHSVLSQALQNFALTYECQGCKRFFLTFLITRKGLKVRLTGRSEFEEVEVPAYIPKEQRPYYRDAKVAFNTNQILPALFMLRTLIEQCMRSAVGIDNKTRMTGDALCQAYANTLEDDFRSRAPSLTETYNKLSSALHEAREDGALFAQELTLIENHFDAKRVFATNPRRREK